MHTQELEAACTQLSEEQGALKSRHNQLSQERSQLQSQAARQAEELQVGRLRGMLPVPVFVHTVFVYTPAGWQAGWTARALYMTYVRCYNLCSTSCYPPTVHVSRHSGTVCSCRCCAEFACATPLLGCPLIVMPLLRSSNVTESCAWTAWLACMHSKGGTSLSVAAWLAVVGASHASGAVLCTNQLSLPLHTSFSVPSPRHRKLPASRPAISLTGDYVGVGC